MRIKLIFAKIRIVWRDLLVWMTKKTIWMDDIFNGFFLTDTAYQYVWSKLDVHQTLIEDSERVDKFHQAIQKTVNSDKVVLDVGTGSGILAFLSSMEGAKKTYGVDSADIIELAKKIAEKNSLNNIEFIRSDLRDLDIEKVDVILIELIGMYVLDEGIVEKARLSKKFLKDGGLMIPSTIKIFAAPVESGNAGLGFWKNHYGIDYSSVEEYPKQQMLKDLGNAKIMANPIEISKIVLGENLNDSVDFECVFKIEEDGEFCGCVVFFELELSDGIVLSTHPKRPLTHWKHIFLSYTKRKIVKRGDKISAKFKTVFNNSKWEWDFLL